MHNLQLKGKSIDTYTINLIYNDSANRNVRKLIKMQQDTILVNEK